MKTGIKSLGGIGILASVLFFMPHIGFAAATSTATSTPPVIPKVTPTHLETYIGPAWSVVGEDHNVTITSTIKNTTYQSPFNVDIEVFNVATGQRVAQHVFERALMSQQSTKNFSFSFIPTEAGYYRVAVGIFNVDWSELLQWTNEATAFTMRNPDPVVPPTPTPVGPFKPEVRSMVARDADTQLGNTVNFSPRIENMGEAGTLTMDIEIYKNNVKVDQKVFENISFAEKETKEIPFSWKADASGVYQISVGLFKPSWDELYEWKDKYTTVIVHEPTQPNPIAGTTIFTDTLSQGWENWSWDAYMGINNGHIEARFSALWGGLYFHSASLSTAGKSALTFSINPLNSRNNMQILAYGEHGEVLGSKEFNVFRDLTPDTWQTVSIPLTDFNAASTTISGIVFQNAHNEIFQTFLLDDMKLQ